jgi:hypothetical protein
MSVPGFPDLGPAAEGKYDPNGAELQTFLNNLFTRVGSRLTETLTANYTAVINDLGKVFKVNGHTLNLRPASELTNGWWCYAKAPGIVAPQEGELINGQTSLTLTGSALITCNGDGFEAIEGAGGQPQKAGVGFTFDGAGSEIAVGIAGDYRVPFDCTIRKWTLLGDGAGDVQIDIWKADFANYPPTASNSICGGAPPALAGASKAEQSNLASWSVDLSEGDVLRFNIDICSGLTRVALILHLTRA